MLKLRRAAIPMMETADLPNRDNSAVAGQFELVRTGAELVRSSQEFFVFLCPSEYSGVHSCHGVALIRRCSGGLRGPFGDDLAVTRKTLGRTVSPEVLVATARGHNGLTGYLVETAGRGTVLEHWHGATP